MSNLNPEGISPGSDGRSRSPITARAIEAPPPIDYISSDSEADIDVDPPALPPPTTKPSTRSASRTRTQPAASTAVARANSRNTRPRTGTQASYLSTAETAYDGTGTGTVTGAANLHPSSSTRSTRPLRFREVYEAAEDPDADARSEPRDHDASNATRYWRDETARHPDTRSPAGSVPPPPLRARSRTKPPRAYLNNPERYEELEQQGAAAAATTPKPWVVESTTAYSPGMVSTPGLKSATGVRLFDEEMGYGPGYTGLPPQTPRDPGMYGDGVEGRGGGGGASIRTDRGTTIPVGPNGRIDFRNLTKEERHEVLRLPWTQWMNSGVKNHFVAFVGEFIGTALFLFFAFAGTEVANIGSNVKPDNSSSGDSNTTTGASTGFNVAVLLYISLAFGFSLMVNVWVFFRISGGLFNPAVTLAMLMVRAISAVRAAWLFVAQMLGALLASVIVRYLFPENFNVRTTLGGGATLAQGVFIEAILTAELVFTIFMLAKEKHRATFIAPVGIGLALFIAEMVGVEFTGGSLNPARSFGPCAVTATFDSEHWIYWVGPLLGSLFAVAFYKFIKILEYEMANPGADGDPINDPTRNPEKRYEIRNSR